MARQQIYHKKTKYIDTINIIKGINTITHGLDLYDPEAFEIRARDIYLKNVSIGNFVSFANNSFEFESLVNINNIKIIIQS